VAAVVVSHDAVNRIALAAMDPSLGAPGDLAQDTGSFNTIEYDLQEDGSVKWRVLSVNEVVREEDKLSPATGSVTSLGPATLSREGTGGP
jgi:broad specificity phosphatase PhoE